MAVAITVPELRVQLNLESEDDDTLLAQKIDAAEAYASSYIGGAIPDPAPAAIKQAVLMLAAFWYEAARPRRRASPLTCPAHKS